MIIAFTRASMPLVITARNDLLNTRSVRGALVDSELRKRIECSFTWPVNLFCSEEYALASCLRGDHMCPGAVELWCRT